jgi:tRNA (guanine-N7-)-methyltransferase
MFFTPNNQAALLARLKRCSYKNMNIKALPTLLPHNVQWSHLFGNNNPVDLEIGCGRTHFLFDRALNFPERNIVGIEWKYEFMAQAQRRIKREGIKNTLAFHGNAWLLVPMLFAPSSISHVMVNFPDPWWKDRHKKRLVLNKIFLGALHERMKADGFILLQTDVEELFESYKKLIAHSGLFRLDTELCIGELENLTKAQTHREKKCLAQGLKIYRALFRRLDVA